MSAPVVRVLGADFPACAHEGCRKHGEDGYCEAACCLHKLVVIDGKVNDDVNAQPKAYCSEHSHRPTRLLEILGHSHAKQTFTRDEVRRIVMAMWAGAGMVFEASGYLQMLQDIEANRAAKGEPTDGLSGVRT